MIAKSTTLIGELETSLGVPTVAFFANWSGEYAVDADAKAGRLLAQTVVQRLRTRQSDTVALVVAARGGYPAFADAVLWAAEHLDVELRVVIPCRVNGAASLLAHAAHGVILHPLAALGAVDSGLCVVPRKPMDASLIPFCPVAAADIAELDPAQESMVVRLAVDRFVRHDQRRLARHIAAIRDRQRDSVDEFTEEQLGKGGTVGKTTLEQRGFDVRVAPIPLAEQLEELLEWAGEALQLFRRPDDRFEYSGELADEVEFEPATTVAAGAIVATDCVWLHKLDTGSPDPHAPRLMGDWKNWNPPIDDANNGEQGPNATP